MTHTIEDRAYWRERARHYGDVYDVSFFERAIEQESAFNPHAVSSAGALGIAQFMPATAAGRGINPVDPEQALQGSAALFREYLDEYKKPELALAAYNAGPGAVAKYGGVPPYDETRNYIRSILGVAPRESEPPVLPVPKYPNPFENAPKGFGGGPPTAETPSGHVPKPGEIKIPDPIDALRQGAAQALVAVAVVGTALVLGYTGLRKMLG